MICDDDTEAGAAQPVSINGSVRILVTWEKQARDYHAVLAVRRNDGSVRLLETDDRIVHGSPRRYRFIYAINEQRIWDHDKTVRRKTGGNH